MTTVLEDTPPTTVPGWRDVLARFHAFTRGHRKVMALATVLFAVATGADALGIAMLSEIADTALIASSLSNYWSPAATWLAASVTAAACSYVATVLTAYAAEAFAVRVRASAYANVLRMSPETLDRHPTGDLLTRIVDDVDQVEAFVVTGMVDAAASLVSVVVYGTAALLLNWQLTLVVAIGAAAVLLLSRKLAGRESSLSLQTQRARGHLMSALEQGVSNVVLIQAYTAQRAEANRLVRTSRRLFRTRMRRQRFTAVQGPLTELIQTLGLLTILGVGIAQVAAGSLTVGGLLAFVAYLEFLQPGVGGLGDLVTNAAVAAGSAERLQELLDQRSPVTDPVTPTRRITVRGELEVCDVHVTGPDGRPRLAGVSLHARPGEILALVGPSGAGKSTLINVLARLRDPTTGQVLLDGIDLRAYPLTQVHRLITVLPQEPLMVDGTVRENLGYGLPAAAPSRNPSTLTPNAGPPTALIRPATLASGAEQFLSRLPDGYDTRIGNRGRSLSGGQRQQLAVARALLRDGTVLILDEPSTGLDPHATDRLITTLREQAAHRTVIVATHDPKLITAADRVVELRPAAPLPS